ncbi:MAG TPA: BlaI/MecI/CopY family transcriptional regulator [Armatimonadota bacterium]|nr:BlaI/MecI/CopY family transcriptional regulator [Armatimonadota bacterium]
MDSKDGARDYVGVRKGLGGQSLGELEAQILDIVWDLEPPVSTTQVFKIMYPRRELSYSTIMLTMAKLARKGILSQERTGDKKTDRFIYRPNITREQMGVALMNAVSQQILRKPLHKAISDLCSTDASDGLVKKLEQIVAQADVPRK